MAHAQLAGSDPMHFLDADSDFELAVRRRVTERAIKVNKEYRDDLAVRIVNTLAKSMRKGGGPR